MAGWEAAVPLGGTPGETRGAQGLRSMTLSLGTPREALRTLLQAFGYPGTAGL